MVSAIIPTYNDSKKIVEIIDNLNKVKDITEIIVVDDGSKPEHKQVFESLSGVKLITHIVNQGKSQAMKTGFLASNGDLIMFVDADLSNMTANYIQALIDPVKNAEYDMTIALIGDKFDKIVNDLNLEFLKGTSGQRVIRKDLLNKHISIFDVYGYLIESEMNKVFFDKYKVTFVYLPNLSNELKVKKKGLIGLTMDIKMHTDIIKHIGIVEFTRQSKIISKLPVLKPFENI